MRVVSTEENLDYPINTVDSKTAFSETQRSNYWQHFGFCSRPNVDDYLLNFKEKNIVIASGSTNRPSIDEGETCLYATEDISIILKPSGEINIKNANTTIKITSTGNIELGSGTLKKFVTDTFVSLFNSHTHVCASPGSASATPLPQLVEATVCTSKVTGE